MVQRRMRVWFLVRRSAAVVGVSGLVVLGAGVGTAHAEDHRDGAILDVSAEASVGVSILTQGRVRLSTGSG